jgi:hypothetical protein
VSPLVIVHVLNVAVPLHAAVYWNQMSRSKLVAKQVGAGEPSSVVLLVNPTLLNGPLLPATIVMAVAVLLWRRGRAQGARSFSE